jgi:hypothetical protein
VDSLARSQIRHSVAHSAELPDKDKHSVPGPVELVPGFVVGSATIPVVIRSGLNGRKFQNTFEGKLQSYEISVDIRDNALAAYFLARIFQGMRSSVKNCASTARASDKKLRARV